MPNQENLKDYPIFKLNHPEHCTVLKTCTIDDFSLEVVGTKALAESYILQYQCFNNAMFINALAGLKIAPECQEKKYPLDAFLISQTGMGSDITTYQDEEMPAADFCHGNPKLNGFLSSECGKMVSGFPYTDEMNGYKLIPITDDNREEIYAEFNEQGFVYKNSQTTMNKIVNQYTANQETTLKEPFIITDAEITNAKIAASPITPEKILDSAITTSKIVDSPITPEKILDSAITNAYIVPQTWAEYIYSSVLAGIDCVMDPIHCWNS